MFNSSDELFDLFINVTAPISAHINFIRYFSAIKFLVQLLVFFGSCLIRAKRMIFYRLPLFIRYRLQEKIISKMCTKICSENTLNQNLWDADPELYFLITQEKLRQLQSLEMIASENFTSVPVLQCLSSCLHNKYSEGLPGQRYYGGNEFIDKVELLCQKRALEAFGLSSDEWGVNVQPYSGSPANFAVYTALVGPNGRIMGLDLADGGHLSHGFMTSKKKVSATSIFFQSMPYKINEKTGWIDYDKLSETAKLFKPKMIIAGISSYSRCLDYKKFRQICDENNCYLFSDMAHVSGLVAAKVIPSPFEFSDVVSTTSHKTLRGPRAGMIFYRKGVKTTTKNGEKIFYDLETKINEAVFPGLQGGPHNNSIAALATSLKQVISPEFINYQTQVILNAKTLSSGLQNLGYKIVTDGTDIHLILIDLRNVGLTGSIAEFILEEVNIACNKNTVPGDKSALNPSGIRLGTPALTTRGLVERDIKQVINFIHLALQIAKKVQKISGSKLSEFKKVLHEDISSCEEIAQLKLKVSDFAKKFPLPGLEKF